MAELGHRIQGVDFLGSPPLKTPGFPMQGWWLDLCLEHCEFREPAETGGHGLWASPRPPAQTRQRGGGLPEAGWEEGGVKTSVHRVPSLFEARLVLSSTYTCPWPHSLYIMKIPVWFLLSRGLQSGETHN